jgi:hypothetical protein
MTRNGKPFEAKTLSRLVADRRVGHTDAAGQTIVRRPAVRLEPVKPRAKGVGRVDGPRLA